MLEVFSILGLIVALTVHEFAHALVADKLGDPTPRSQGRLSLNPLRHLDPIGTLMLFLVSFGWGKPVQIDPYNFKNPRRDELLVALAGPVSNLILASFFALLHHLLGLNQIVFYVLIAYNLTLALFNLLPIYPLDGSKILLNLIHPDNQVHWEEALKRYSLPILLICLLPIFGQSNLISLILNTPRYLILNLLWWIINLDGSSFS